jgi:AmmeMemoRadiSam system protein B
MVSLLALCDGTRDLNGLKAALQLRTGLNLSLSELRSWVEQMDASMLLEGGSYQRASDRLLEEYREAGHRTPAQAGLVYPADPDDLRATMRAYWDEAPVQESPQPPVGTLSGIVCPHIDYARGHETYAQVWRRAAPALEDVELVVMLGTDHSGSPGALTLTLQDYATPLGVLPTDRDIVNELAKALTTETAFAEEVHHVREHSIELASVWLQYSLNGRSCPVVPVLCGSFQRFVAGEGNPGDDQAIAAVSRCLRQAMSGRRTLVIAAGDLAHVGPAFGDSLPIDPVGQTKLTADDHRTVAAICEGDAEAFFQASKRESDARRICGLSPIYLALKLLETSRGESLGYDQCSADDKGESLVSIVGVLLYERDPV